MVPRAGRVTLFYNLLPNSLEMDPFDWHGSCAVTAGEQSSEKWVANMWFNLGLTWKCLRTANSKRAS